MERRQFELELRDRIEFFFSDEIIAAELTKRRCLITGNRRTDICLLAHILSHERPELFDELLDYYYHD